MRSCSIGGLPKDYANWTPFRGTIDELRISSAARYDSDFTPPAEFTADAQTAGLYHFNEGQGDILNDSSGNGHHGKIVGAKWVRLDQAAPRARTSLSFDENSEVRLPSLQVDLSQPFTIETWATSLPSDYAEGRRAIVRITNLTGMVLHNPARCVFQFEAKNDAYGENFPIPHKERVHLAGVRDANELRLYVNGKISGRQVMKPDSLEPKFFPRLGGTGKHGFVGSIDQVRISKGSRYTREFTPQTRFDPDADTLALYLFDEGQGDMLNDSSGNGHHGKIVGAKWVLTDESLPRAGAITASSETNLLTELTIGEYTTKSPANFIRDPQGVIVADGVLVGKTWKPGETSIRVRFRSLTEIVGSSGRPGLWIGFTGPEKSSLNAQFRGAHWELRRIENWDDTSTFKSLDRQPAPSRPTGEREIEFRLHNRTLTLIDGGQVVAEAPDVDFEPQAITIGTINSQVLVTSWTSRKPEIQSAPAQQSPPKPALDFSDGLARVEMPRVFNASDHFTAELFYTPLGPTGKNRLLFNSGGAFTLKSWGPNNIAWHLAITDRINAPANLQVGARTHLAGVSTGKTFSLFVQGRLIASAPLTGNLNANPSKGYLGSQAQALETWEPLNGLIDEFRYSRTARYSQSFVPPDQLKPDQDTLILYDFREGQGDTLTDASGNNHHGKIVGAKWVKPSQDSLANQVESPAANHELDLSPVIDGALARVEIVHPRPVPPLTIEMFATPRTFSRQSTTPAPSDSERMNRSLFSSGRDSVIWLKQLDKIWQTGARSQGTRHAIAWSRPLPLKRRAHLASVVTPTELRFFVDGKRVMTSTIDYTLAPDWGPLVIGWYGGDGKYTQGRWEPFDGTVDEVRISTSARYDADFTPAERFSPDAQTWALYHCDEGSGHVLTDASGNNHHGQNFGAKWVRGD